MRPLPLLSPRPLPGSRPSSPPPNKNTNKNRAAKLDKREVNVAGEGDFEGPSLLTLIEESGERNWDSVFLSGAGSVVERDDINDDWILLYEPPNPGFGSPVGTYTLLAPDRPRGEWLAGIEQFDVSK